ncbi:MAG: cytochrome C [Geobacter sp.]|nr:cytochrome C [Geobacter sp.]
MKSVLCILVVITSLGVASFATGAEGPKFYGIWTNADGGGRVNRHNLSGDPRHTASVTYKAVYDSANPRTTEICIFCHTPHNASPAAALWGRKPTVTSSFGHYSSTTLYIHTEAGKTVSNYNEPNYSSRLCLSCHDGATALGAVLNGPEIAFDGGQTIAQSGYNIFNPNQGGNDATQHHHPISFKYNDTVRTDLNSAESKAYKLPTENKAGGPPYYNLPEVKIDRYGFMQCVTCHNPHQNMSDSDDTTPFWVLTNARASDGQVGNGNVYDTVCLSCHPNDLGGIPIQNPYNY